MDNPENWNIGKEKGDGAPFPDGKVRVVKSIADPDDTVKRLSFVLATVIECDEGLDIRMGRRSDSPIKTTIERRLDCADRYLKTQIHSSSPYGPLDDQDPTVIRDDSEDAVAYASAYRKAHELGPYAGSIVFDRITHALNIGDRVYKINGRDIDLQQNIGSLSEGPVFPVVVSRTLVNEGGPKTILQLSDRRANPPTDSRQKEMVNEDLL
jgi:hypothetical protein